VEYWYQCSQHAGPSLMPARAEARNSRFFGGGAEGVGPLLLVTKFKNTFQIKGQNHWQSSSLTQLPTHAYLTLRKPVCHAPSSLGKGGRRLVKQKAGLPWD
jgi:hypothetical protein